MADSVLIADLIATDGTRGAARSRCRAATIRTPAFMPVGTGGTVKAMYMDQVRGAGADIILGNTYHLMLRPGAERVARLGGLHEFARWPHPILTDSGGFQVMSLSQLRKLDENGVTFRSHIDGAAYELTPERSIEIQGLLDSDIQMQLDECVALPAERKRDRARHGAVAALGRALQGGVRRAAGQGDVRHRAGRRRRRACASARREALAAMELKGYAVGGLAVGEPQAVMLDMLDITCPRLPADKPRYLMGVGTPDDILESVARGIDMFDCVMPTRAGRHGLAYTGAARSICATPATPTTRARSTRRAIARRRATIRAPTCTISSSRGETLGAMLLTWNNLAYYQQLMPACAPRSRRERFADAPRKSARAGRGGICRRCSAPRSCKNACTSVGYTGAMMSSSTPASARQCGCQSRAFPRRQQVRHPEDRAESYESPRKAEERSSWSSRGRDSCRSATQPLGYGCKLT